MGIIKGGVKVKDSKKITVGIPRALAYYIFYPMWKTFFEKLGATVVSSAETTKKILNNGVKEAVTDACVPIKIFHGHVMELKDQVDYIFIPRLVNVAKDAVFCPKFLGLPDMVRCSIDDLPPIIDVRVDMRKGKLALIKSFFKIGKLFTNNYFQIYSAYRDSLNKFNEFKALLLENKTPLDALSIIEGNNIEVNSKANELTFGLVGYPYEIYDKYVSVDVIEKLRSLNVRIFTVDMVPDSVYQSTHESITKELFWYFSDRAIKAGMYFLNNSHFDGVIHVTAFSCGPDFMVNKLLELEAKKLNKTPFTTLMIDEQTGDAGISTRLEAFVDMVKRQKGLDEPGVIDPMPEGRGL